MAAAAFPGERPTKHPMKPLLFLGNLNWVEVLVILFVGLLIFGSRLPEVGRSLGRGLLEFKKGLRGVQDQMNEIERESDRQVEAELRSREQERQAARSDAAPPEPRNPQAPGSTPPEPRHAGPPQEPL
jgi:sec-independent protein translocase protein TatA